LKFRAISYFWNALTAKRMEIIIPFCQRQNCSPPNVLFIDVQISLIGLLLGVPPLGATITLYRVARACQRQLGFLVEILSQRD